MTSENSILTSKNIQNKIFTIRALQIILDSELADMYKAPIARINKQIKRNLELFSLCKNRVCELSAAKTSNTALLSFLKQSFKQKTIWVFKNEN